MPAPKQSKQGRIPATLQAVFLASNRGKDVNKPPPQKVASKVFFRNWLFQRQAGSKDGKNKSKSLFGGVRNRKKDSKENMANMPKIIAPKKTAIPTLSPQAYLDAMIRSQGYSTRRFKALQSAYYNKPTPLQNASYHLHLIDMAKAFDHGQLAALLATGLSPNPCNNFGESLVHTVSRRGDAKALKIMLDAGANLQVADDYGRTPLHDCCWSANPAFDVAELILGVDVRLFHVTDCRGAVPLSYVRRESWAAWIEYLESNKNRLWPKRNLKNVSEEEAPPLTMAGPNSQPMVDPPNALTPELAVMVASGKMTPEEALFLKYDKADDMTADSSEYSDSDDESEFDSDYDSGMEDDDFSFDEGEMEDILASMSIPHARPVKW